MRWLAVLVIWVFASAALPAFASEDVHFGAVPAWVDRAQPPAAPANPGGSAQVLLLDRQVRFSSDGEERYAESVVKVLNTQGLRDAGNLLAVWDPAFGDLTVHEARIIRGGETIDLLAGAPRSGCFGARRASPTPPSLAC